MRNGSAADHDARVSPAALPEGAVACVVQAGEIETPYVRAGAGAPVLLLSLEGLMDPLSGLLFREVAHGFRAIAPTAPAGIAAMSRGEAPAISVSAWLRDVIDGLGLVRPSIVAEDALGAHALGFVLTDSDRAGRLVVVCRDVGDPALPGAAAADAFRGGGGALLILRFDVAAVPPQLSPGAAARLAGFLGADPPRPVRAPEITDSSMPAC